MIFINHQKIQILKREISPNHKNQVSATSTDKYPGDTEKSLAQKSYKQGKFDVTVSSYEKILNQTPNDWDARFKLGVMLYSKKDKRALKHFDYILEKNPSYVHNVSIRSWVKILRKNLSKVKKAQEKIPLTASQKEALRSFKSILEKNPNHPDKEIILEAIHKIEKY